MHSPCFSSHFKIGLTLPPLSLRLAYSAGIADSIAASYLGSILPLLMCADLQLQAEAVTLVGWLACSSNENACAIGNFDSFVSYVAILMGSTSARVQKQACARTRQPSLVCCGGNSADGSGLLGHVRPERQQQSCQNHQRTSVSLPSRHRFHPLHSHHCFWPVTIDLHGRCYQPSAAATRQRRCTPAGAPFRCACRRCSPKRAPQMRHLHRHGPPLQRRLDIPHRWSC